MTKVWIVTLAALLFLASCGAEVRTLPENGASSFAEQVNTMSENLLVALSNHDEAAYTQDMDAEMKVASSGSKFEQTYQATIGVLGKYISGEMVRVEETGQFRAVIYDARFEKEEHVTVRVVYNMAGSQPLVAGLWFDSPKLRER